MIDLYSDTQTRPTQGMREAMARAVVGDEQSNDDPTTRELCARVAALLGQADGVFMPSGTMCNLVSILVQTRAGDEIIVDDQSHIYNTEAAGAAAKESHTKLVLLIVSAGPVVVDESQADAILWVGYPGEEAGNDPMQIEADRLRTLAASHTGELSPEQQAAALAKRQEELKMRVMTPDNWRCKTSAVTGAKPAAWNWSWASVLDQRT